MNETDIRNLLISRLGASSRGAGAAFISELFIDSFSRRADLVMANGKLAVFEIKSERDTVERLEGQISTYQKFFEEVTVVCAHKHQRNVYATVTERVGIWLINSDGEISILRKAKAIQLPSVQNWLSFLPVDQLSILLKEYGLRSSGNRTSLLEAASLLPPKKVRAYVLNFLKSRHKIVDEIKKKKLHREVLDRANELKFGSTQLHDYINSLSCRASAIPRRVNL